MKNMKSLLAIAGLLACVGPLHAASYAFTDLGTLGGTDSAAFAINQDGQVVGWSYAVGGYQYATLWSAGQVSNLGALPGARNSQAFAISPTGRVAGNSYSDGSAQPSNHAVVWNGTTPTDLAPRAGFYSEARGVNAAGLVVGQSVNAQSASHATVWSASGAATDLGTLGGGQSNALGINGVGQVVGYADTSETYIDASRATRTIYRAAVWNGTTATDLGTLGGHTSMAYAVNDEGLVVGVSETPDISIDGYQITRAVSWKGGVIKALDSLGGSNSGAQAVNSAGVAVGYSELPNHGGTRAVVWNGQQVTDLNTTLDAATVSAGWRLYSAYGINDQGWIVGTAVNTNTESSRAFLLKPVDRAPETCAVSYHLTKAQPLAFNAEVTVRNLSGSSLSGWNVGWTYSALPLFYSIKNAKLSVASGRAVKAVPVAANQAIAAGGSTVFTFSSLKGKDVPQVSALTAALGGVNCAVSVLP